MLQQLERSKLNTLHENANKRNIPQLRPYARNIGQRKTVHWHILHSDKYDLFSAYNEEY